MSAMPLNDARVTPIEDGTPRAPRTAEASPQDPAANDDRRTWDEGDPIRIERWPLYLILLGLLLSALWAGLLAYAGLELARRVIG